ncbi:MAG TPA: hypothetical protein VLF60_00605 [Candidatus Saccharimonadales bacterium]|nr:hypothetical protein [Candidatus Saccharimonadales bacterium]
MREGNSVQEWGTGREAERQGRFEVFRTRARKLGQATVGFALVASTVLAVPARAVPERQPNLVSQAVLEHNQLLQKGLHGLSAETVRDELTDISERVPLHMENGFDYTVNAAGNDLLSDTGVAIRPMLQVGIEDAEHEAQHDPRWNDELIRRKLELKQHEATVEFAKMHGSVRITSFSLDGRNEQEGVFGEAPLRAVLAQLDPDLDQTVLEDEEGNLDPNTLLDRCFEYDGALCFVSLPPAEVRKGGRSATGGYDAKRQKALLRVATPQAEATSSTVINQLRSAYDTQLEAQFGNTEGEWFGGRRRPKLTATSSLEFILQQPDLIDQHLKKVKEVLRTYADPATREAICQSLRYDFAAGIAGRIKGRTVTSLQQAGEAARKAGETFEGDCPLKSGKSAAEQLRQLGLLRNKKPHCPFCDSDDLELDVLDEVCGDKKCRDCGSEVVNGIVTERHNNVPKEEVSTQLGTTVTEFMFSKKEMTLATSPRY